MLDQCSFLDPRVKSLKHVPEAKQKDVHSMTLTHLGGDTAMSESGVAMNDEQAKDADKAPCLLESLLGDFQTSPIANADDPVSDIQRELNQYITEKACPMDIDPLKW